MCALALGGPCSSFLRRRRRRWWIILVFPGYAIDASGELPIEWSPNFLWHSLHSLSFTLSRISAGKIAALGAPACMASHPIGVPVVLLSHTVLPHLTRC